MSTATEEPAVLSQMFHSNNWKNVKKSQNLNKCQFWTLWLQCVNAVIKVQC